MTRKEAEKELIAMLKEAEGGPTYSMEEVDAYMRELLHPKNQRRRGPQGKDKA